LFQVRIKVTLPKLSLLLSLWWSTATKDLNNGCIVRFSKIYHTAPPAMGSGSYTTILDSSYNRDYSSGTTDMSLSPFPQPILTSEISFGDIVFTANPIGNLPLWDFGHIVNFNLEVFGCDNYKIDES